MTGARQGIGTDGSIPYAAVVGDFDADGRPDVAIANLNDNSVTVLRNNAASGSTTYFTSQTFPAGPNPSSIAVINVDGSATQSLVVANYGTNRISVLTGNNTASFGADLISYASGTTSKSPYQVSVADFNGDGKQDLLLNTFGGTNVGLLLGDQTASSIITVQGTLPTSTSAVYSEGTGGAYKKTTATFP